MDGVQLPQGYIQFPEIPGTQCQFVDFNAGKTQLVLFDWSNNTVVKMNDSYLYFLNFL